MFFSCADWETAFSNDKERMLDCNRHDSRAILEDNQQEAKYLHDIKDINI